VPFPEYADVKAKRTDCEERWLAITEEIDDLEGMTMLDVCCANAFMGFMFLQCGGFSVVGVELDDATRAFVNALAQAKSLPLQCFKTMADLQWPYDIVLYLDTVYHEGTEGMLEQVKQRTRGYAFVSPSGRHGKYNARLLEDCQKLWDSVEVVYEGFEKRRILRCE